GSLLAVGLTSMLGVQATMNIAVVTSSVPATGVPLPFISYGGSSLVFTMMAIGLILNVSQYPDAPAPGRSQPILAAARCDQAARPTPSRLPRPRRRSVGT